VARDWHKELTYKQLFFCKEYLANNGNATQAALSAGYSTKSAPEIGLENLGKPLIIDYLEELNARRNARLDADADWVVKSLAGLASANMALNDDGEPLDSTAANKSLELIGKTHGIYTDKKELNVGGSFNISWLEPDNDADSDSDDDDQDDSPGGST